MKRDSLTVDASLERIESRQEVLIRGVDKQTATIVVLSGLMDEMVEWTQTPPSTELGDTMRALLAGQQNMYGTLIQLGREVRALALSVAELERQVSEALAASPA